MSEKSRSLVLLRRAEGVSETALMPFEQFLVGLCEGRADDTVTMAGSARWSAFPIEHAIADGLWPVLLRVAEKLGRGILTERQVVEDIAPRVDRLVNAGLVIVYPTIDGACAAFLREVIDPVYAASRGKSGSDSDMLQAVWQRPVAKFFAVLIRVAQNYGNEIERTLTLIRDENSADKYRDITFIDVKRPLDFQSLVSFLRLESVRADLSLRPSEDPYQFVRDASRKLEDLRMRQKALMRLPLRLRTLPDDLIMVGASVDYQWLRTQLLLAAAQLPDREYLLGNEFMFSAQAVIAGDADEIVRSFFRRMIARGMSTPEREDTILETIVRDRLTVLKSGMVTSTVLDLELLSSLFVVLKPEHLPFDRETALRVAFGDELVTEGILDSLLASAQVEYWRTHVMPVIVWETLTASDIERMVYRGPLPLRVLVEGVVKMDAEERARAIAWLFEADILTEDTVVYLMGEGMVVLTADFLASHYHKMPSDLLARCLTDVLQKTDEDDAIMKAFTPAVLYAVLVRLSESDARAVIDHPSTRVPLVKHVLTEIVDPDYRASRGIATAIHTHFVSLLGNDRWYRLVFAVEICMREDEYVCGREQGAGEMMPRWNNLNGRLAIAYNLPGWLGVSARRAQQILRAYAEDDMFAWLYAGRDDLSARLGAYRVARDRYYK